MLPKEQTGKSTNRQRNYTANPSSSPISPQTTQAIKDTKNNNSTGPNNVNIRHLKHLGPLAINYVTEIFNLSLNQNIIPQIWKLAKIIPIPKSNKDPGLGTLYRPISLLSPIAKIMEKNHSSIHHRKHPKQSSPTWFQDTPFHLHSHTPTHKPNHTRL